jgi:TolB-like protein
LPFVNLGAPIDVYFADGITEEITARLAAIQGLGVIARTTAVQYKDTDKTVSDIGRELSVDYVLEGTVRWESLPDGSSRVRVTPQLIRVADATHVWAEIYEEPVASVFQVQSAIAERVVGEMGLTLRATERLALKAEPTSNVEAWRFYQLGNQYLSSSRTDAGVQEALAMFESALELDPDFDLAQRKLAEAHASLYWASFRLRFGVAGLDYEREIEQLYLDSFGADTASYYLTKAILLLRAEGAETARAFFDSARAILEPRVSVRPGDARLHAQLGLAMAGLDRADVAIREGRMAVDLLPLAEDAYAGSALADNLAHIYTLVGEHDAAIEQIESILSVDAPVTRAWVENDPTWVALRDDPRFQRLMEEAG